jgi:hypothetical protein
MDIKIWRKTNRDYRCCQKQQRSLTSVPSAVKSCGATDSANRAKRTGQDNTGYTGISFLHSLSVIAGDPEGGGGNNQPGEPVTPPTNTVPDRNGCYFHGTFKDILSFDFALSLQKHADSETKVKYALSAMQYVHLNFFQDIPRSFRPSCMSYRKLLYREANGTFRVQRLTAPLPFAFVLGDIYCGRRNITLQTL